MNMDVFEQGADRRGTDCIKWDFQEADYGRGGLLPFFIADADYPTAPGVIEALKKRASHGVFGYTDLSEAYYSAVMDWFERRHGLALKREWIVPTTGIVPSISHAVMLFTPPGAGVVVQPPVYDPFYSVIEANGRTILCNDLIQENGTYRMDYEDLEGKLRDGAKMVILCSPHNPVGRVWKREELERLAWLCRRYEAVLVSDEIHCDLILGEEKYCSAGLLEEIKDRLVLCLSPSKTFNIAGLCTSNIVIPNPEMRKLYQDWLYRRYMFSPNLMGLTACQAAYETGEGWLDGQLEFLRENKRFLLQYFSEHIPAGHVNDPEGTYLAWSDFTSLGMTSDQLVGELVKRGIAVNGGNHYGEAYDGFIRLNFACPKTQLERGLAAIRQMVGDLSPA